MATPSSASPVQANTQPRILLHGCCGPCSLAPVRALRAEGYAVTAFFFNPNIHPEDEYNRRRQTMAEAAEKMDLPLLCVGGPVPFEVWQNTLHGERELGKRCRFCYRGRLYKTALLAAQMGFDFFSTSLLYSRYQNHTALQEMGTLAAEFAGKPADFFLYQDFRTMWNEGIHLSKTMGLYRQKYCACLLSQQKQ